MPKIDPISLRNWFDGDTVFANDYKTDRDLYVTSVNELHATKLTLVKDLLATTAPMVFYIDPVKGSDIDNDGRSISTPFRSIYQALSKVVETPVINHQITINLAPGDYTGESVIYSFRSPLFGKGSLTITGSPSGTDKQNYIVDSLDFTHWKVPVTVQGVAFNQSGSAIYADSSSRVSVQFCSFSVPHATGTTIRSENGSRVYVQNCEFIQQNYCFYGFNNSQIISVDNLGSGNTNLCILTSSVLYKQGTQPAATTAQTLIGAAQVR